MLTQQLLNPQTLTPLITHVALPAISYAITHTSNIRTPTLLSTRAQSNYSHHTKALTVTAAQLNKKTASFLSTRTDALSHVPYKHSRPHSPAKIESPDLFAKTKAKLDRVLRNTGITQNNNSTSPTTLSTTSSDPFRSIRHFSTSSARANKQDTTLSYIPHAFTSEDAARRITEADQRRLFAPIVVGNKTQLALKPDANPLKKTFIPMFGINASILATHYRAEYGIDHTYTTTETDDKGNTTTTTHTYTVWDSITGTVGRCNYTPDRYNMSIYGGFTWNANTLEDALGGYQFTHNLQPFDAKSVDAETFIDPFLMRSAFAQEIANQRINDSEEVRIRNDINNRVSCDHISINSYTTSYNQFYLSSYLLPAYILQYPNTPPRVLPALNSDDTKVFGAAPLSITKFTAASTIAATAVAALFPAAAIPARVAMVAASSIASALWAKYRLSAHYQLQARKLEQRTARNETVSETIADKNRFQATARDFSVIQDPLKILNVDAAYYKIMGLDPEKPVTEEMVQNAFRERIMKAHPDQKGSTEETRQILDARSKFTDAFNKRKDNKKSEPGKRYFSTLARPTTTRVKEPPRSVFDPNANALIVTVLEKQDYDTALTMVTEGKVHPDGHNRQENTLLTEAAKRGTVEDVTFAIEKLGASIDTSCDCPHHNTALHYAARKNRIEVIKALLKKGANPNLINSLGETPLDTAYACNNEPVIKLLEEHGALRHRSLTQREGLLSQMRGRFFGYSSSERTRLLENNSPNVICLPPLKK